MDNIRGMEIKGIKIIFFVIRPAASSHSIFGSVSAGDRRNVCYMRCKYYEFNVGKG